MSVLPCCDESRDLILVTPEGGPRIFECEACGATFTGADAGPMFVWADCGFAWSDEQPAAGSRWTPELRR